MPLSSDDIYWAETVIECTNDIPLDFGRFLEHDEFIWIEHIPGNKSQIDKFELVTFEIIQPDKVMTFSQQISNPKRQPISHADIELIIGESWDKDAKPTIDPFNYWLVVRR